MRILDAVHLAGELKARPLHAAKEVPHLLRHALGGPKDWCFLALPVLLGQELPGEEALQFFLPASTRSVQSVTAFITALVMGSQTTG